MRQGEALGLRWQYVDLDAGDIRVWWQLRRRQFEHGCGSTCGRTRGGNCPQRWLPTRSGETVLEDGFVMKEPKGKSRRTIPLPAELVDQLRTHRRTQGIERALAGDRYVDHDLVFARPDGRPIDPAEDHAEWKSILPELGIAEARLHDARHTAATTLLALGVSASVVQEILGHSDIRVTQGYLHVASEMARAATSRIGNALLG